MAACFLDTSAVVKRYVQETGTAWIRRLTAASAGHFLYVARIVDVEATAAFARRRQGGSLNSGQAATALHQFRVDLAQEYRILEITIPLLQRASALADKHALRAYDAVQLAAALEVAAQASSLTRISADADLNLAAMAERLAVDDPNAHP